MNAFPKLRTRHPAPFTAYSNEDDGFNPLDHEILSHAGEMMNIWLDYDSEFMRRRLLTPIFDLIEMCAAGSHYGTLDLNAEDTLSESDNRKELIYNAYTAIEEGLSGCILWCKELDELPASWRRFEKRTALARSVSVVGEVV